jgi:cell division protein FtsB
VRQPSPETRLCPHCANSLAVDALVCPYCKADLLGSAEPEWPGRDAEEHHSSEPNERSKLTVRSKAILVLGLLVFSLGVYLVGTNVERQDLRPQMAEQQKALEEKDQKVKALESQLARLREDQQGSAKQIEELRARLQEREKDSAATQRRLTAAQREIERLSASRNATPQRAATRNPNPPAPPSAAPRPTAPSQPRLYETVRPTRVYEEPANSARIVAQISKGTQITVVGSGGGWLEIRSKHGKPPGFINADDAMFVSRAAN